jgi:uncharacterized protein (DUF2147 family)
VSLNHRIVECMVRRHLNGDGLVPAEHKRMEESLAARFIRLAAAGLIVLLAAIQPVAADPSAAGLWQKVDAETGKTVGWFLFVERNGLYEGIIAKLFLRPQDPANPICSQCQDDRKNAPMLGLPLIRGMKRVGLKYEDGNILDPRDGNVYKAIMSVSPDGKALTVRGYLGFTFLGRDEIWYRLPDDAAKTLDPIIIAKYLPAQAPAIPKSAKHRQSSAKAADTVH